MKLFDKTIKKLNPNNCPIIGQQWYSNEEWQARLLYAGDDNLGCVNETTLLFQVDEGDGYLTSVCYTKNKNFVYISTHWDKTCKLSPVRPPQTSLLDPEAVRSVFFTAVYDKTLIYRHPAFWLKANHI